MCEQCNNNAQCNNHAQCNCDTLDVTEILSLPELQKMRGFTKEEAELYEESLDELFEPTGKQFYKTLEGENAKQGKD